MTLHRIVPSDIEADRLADLLDDARAIPAAAFGSSRSAVRPVIDLTTPAQRVAVRIPGATVSLLESAEHHFADFSR